jgi:hypothetical protein
MTDLRNRKKAIAEEALAARCATTLMWLAQCTHRQGVVRKEDEIPCVPRKSAETKQNEEKILLDHKRDQIFFSVATKSILISASPSTSLSPLHQLLLLYPHL